MAFLRTIITHSDHVEEMDLRLGVKLSGSGFGVGIIKASDEESAIEVAREMFSENLPFADDYNAEIFAYLIDDLEAYEIMNNNGVVIGWSVISN